MTHGNDPPAGEPRRRHQRRRQEVPLARRAASWLVWWVLLMGLWVAVDPISSAFLALGLLTAIVGALFCFRERHLKRLLAFSTVSHAGMFLVGLSWLTPLGLAGAAVYVVGHGLVKAALFLCVGIVLHRLGSVNETWLHGRGRRLPVTGVVFTLAALGLADLPPFATYLGKGWISGTASARGMAWVAAVLIACSILVGGAVLRVAGGVFCGLGDPPAEDPEMAKSASEEKSETDEAKQRTPLTMIIPPGILVLAAIAVGVMPHLGAVVQAAAVRFEDQDAYNAAVLYGAHVTHPAAVYRAESTGVILADVLSGAGSAFGGLVLAAVALYWRRIPFLRRSSGPDLILAGPVQRFQSGVVNDYITWVVIGVTCLGAALALSIR